MKNPIDSSLKMQVVCECGFKILVVPNLDSIVRSIEAHAETHAESTTDKKKAKTEYSRIEEQLTQKVLLSICQKNGQH